MPIDILEKALTITADIVKVAPKHWLPPSEGSPAQSEMVIYKPLYNGTRGYIEKIANQINGCYEKGWFDACAVMIRRLLETLIIEVFESKNIENKIQKGGDFIYLRDLINVILSETSFNLGRNTKKALPKLKDIGDKSAHSRRFIAIRQDIDDIKSDLRVVIQELLILSGIKI
ncbi:MAG: DUF4145 domain-containing protein [Bacteroidetes bacterium]|nr:DUF4145 domain-containing protein [Bacteroidota bacterium]